MVSVTASPTSTLPQNLRPFDARRDLAAIADLIETCFENTLDPDGRRYLYNMRKAVGSKGLNRWVAMASGDSSLPLAGFVWEENARVVGNLSMIPFFSQGRRIYLIANVAVYKEYRRRRIARALTEAALERSRQRRVNEIWLHVRDDNEAALNLYTSMGFEPQVARTTWNSLPGFSSGETSPDLRVIPRVSRHWEKQRLWLAHNYPLNLRWHFTLKMRSFQPGLWGFIHRLVNEVDVRHWSVQKRKDLLGLVSLQSTKAYADRLWLAVPPENEDLAVLALLSVLRRGRRRRRPLTLDYPAGRAEHEIRAAGFKPQHTLIWMRSKSFAETHHSKSCIQK